MRIEAPHSANITARLEAGNNVDTVAGYRDAALKRSALVRIDIEMRLRAFSAAEGSAPGAGRRLHFSMICSGRLIVANPGH
ncbi:hypothetical protein AAFP32_14040 [Brevibacterium sp. CBA3109]|uniref:Uncharacterized protein n=1 Tax=Brevibacterium koreense TaxID=3140787 RepID=A0AAU7UJB5_9MICO